MRPEDPQRGQAPQVGLIRVRPELALNWLCFSARSSFSGHKRRKLALFCTGECTASDGLLPAAPTGFDWLCFYARSSFSGQKRRKLALFYILGHDLPAGPDGSGDQWEIKDDKGVACLGDVASVNSSSHLPFPKLFSIYQTLAGGAVTGGNLRPWPFSSECCKGLL